MAIGAIIIVAMIFVFGVETTSHILWNCFPLILVMWAGWTFGDQCPFSTMLPHQRARLLDSVILHFAEQRLSLLDKTITWVDPNAGTAKEVPNAQAKLISELEKQEWQLREALRDCYRVMCSPWWKLVEFVIWCKWVRMARMERKAWERFYMIESQLEDPRCSLSDDAATRSIDRKLEQRRAARVSGKA
ncbi:hypothetical protein C8R45DRAFT_1081037 [Mycena sanguinolenta]|nr:hypothetical protein C8R45DRAFT_1081037 [Mycena sanguinolenta]